MTEELGNELAELLQKWIKTDKLCVAFTGAIVGCALILMIVEIIWQIYRMKKLRAWKDEYYASLNEEQKKAVNQWREFNK